MGYPIKVGQQYKTPENLIVTINAISVNVSNDRMTVVLRFSFDGGDDVCLLPDESARVKTWVKVKDTPVDEKAKEIARRQLEWLSYTEDKIL